MTIKVKGDHPTLAHIALAINESRGTSFTASDVSAAAKARGFRPKDGRLPIEAVPNVDHELRIRGAAGLTSA